MSDILPSDGTDQPAQDTAPLPELKFLKTLVTVLAGTMIVGLITVIALLVIRLGPQNAAPFALPAQVTLPEGTTAQSVSMSAERIVVLTNDDRVLVFDLQGAPLGSVKLSPAP